MPGAVLPFERVARRNPAQTSDRLSPGGAQRELLNTVLNELKLKFDRDGNRRSAYSLRHTYICMRLMEGADIYQIAKNCRTSVEMIEKFYASHIKNTLDAAAINVRKARLVPIADKPSSQPKSVKASIRRKSVAYSPALGYRNAACGCGGMVVAPDSKSGSVKSVGSSPSNRTNSLLADRTS